MADNLHNTGSSVRANVATALPPTLVEGQRAGASQNLSGRERVIAQLVDAIENLTGTLLSPIIIDPAGTTPQPVIIQGGGGGGTADVDQSPFTAGVSSGTPMMGEDPTSGELLVVQLSPGTRKLAVASTPGAGTIVAFGQAAVTASAAALPSHACLSVIVKAPQGNGLVIFIGGVGVTTATGMEVLPGGGAINLQVSNSNQVYVVAANTGSNLSWVALN